MNSFNTPNEADMDVSVSSTPILSQKISSFRCKIPEQAYQSKGYK